MKQFLLMPMMLVIASGHGGAESWRFAVTGDSYGTPFTYDENCVNTLILGELAEEMLDRDVECLLFPGDLVMGDSCSYDMETQLLTWRAALQPLYDAGVKVYPVRGNHDDDSGLAPWHNVFSGDYALPQNGPAGEENLTFSAPHKNALFIGLDQYIKLHRINQDWLDATLAQNAAPHIFVFAHEPAFSVAHDDCMGFFPEERDVFWRSIANAGGRTYFCTHDHFYNHARIDDLDGDPDNDLHQFVVGTAGSIQWHFWNDVYDGDNGDNNPVLVKHVHPRYGYLLAEVDGPTVTLTFMGRHTQDLSLPGQYEPYDLWSYTVEPALNVLWPNGAEHLTAGSTQTIRWNTSPFAQVGAVLIQFSADGGSSWTTLTISQNSGSYPWIIEGDIQSEQCLIHIAAVEKPDICDTSDAPFTVFHCRTALPADLNGDCYVNMQDLAVLAAEWLRCGNPFDPMCSD